MTRILAIATVVLSLTTATNAQYASQVIHASGLSGAGLYDDPAAALGKPTTDFVGVGGTFRSTLVTAPYSTTPSGGKTLVTIGTGAELVLGFASPVRNDPANPYGIDLLVFGNSFFTYSTLGPYVSPADNPEQTVIGAALVREPGVKVQVAKTYDGANTLWKDLSPNADNLFPTQAHAWNRATDTWGPEMDFTKPVNPALTESSFFGKTLADGIDLYQGSGGGTGYDLQGTGLDWVQFVRFTSSGQGLFGEIDAVADVTAVPEPSALAICALGLAALFRRRR